jgi:hypothetical protein
VAQRPAPLEVELGAGGLRVDGQVLAGGPVVGKELEDDGVPRLARALVARVRQGPTGRWRLVTEAAVPCASLRAVIATAARLKIGRPLVSVDRGDAITLGLVDGKQVQHGLALTLFVSRRRLAVYSLSEQEGSLHHPAVEVPGLDGATLAARLAELKSRHPDEHQLIVVCSDEPDLDAGELLPVLAAVRGVFPDLVLSAGIM